MNKIRIVEKIDSNGVSRFIVERLWFGMFWWIWEHEYGPIEFDTLEKCREWLDYRHTANTLIHEYKCWSIS